MTSRKKSKFLHKSLWFGLIILSIVVSTTLSFLIVKHEPIENVQELLTAKILELNEWQSKEFQEPDEIITMLFAGDIMLGRYINTLRERNGGDFPFSFMSGIIDQIESQLGVEQLNLIVGNLEGPITDSDYVNPGTAMIFNFQPEVADLLASAGFTTLSMANNHQYDQGRQGIDQTYTYLKAAGLDGFGHPDTPDGIYSAVRYEFKDKVVGFLGLSDVDFNLDEDATVAKIQELKADGIDFLVLGIHWGVEYEPTARSYVTDMAHKFVDAGADMIWGHHPHVIQNWELYNGAPIYYSLGNFVFDQYWSESTQEGLVVGLRLEGEKITTTELYVDLVNKGEPKARVYQNQNE